MVRKYFLDFNAVKHTISFYKEEEEVIKIVHFLLGALNEDLVLIDTVRGMFGEMIPANVILNDFKKLLEFEVNEIVEILKIVVTTYLDFGYMGYVSCKTLTRVNVEEYIANQL